MIILTVIVYGRTKDKYTYCLHCTEAYRGLHTLSFKLKTGICIVLSTYEVK